jgi:hypothetical protein
LSGDNGRGMPLKLESTCQGFCWDFLHLGAIFYSRAVGFWLFALSIPQS